MIGSKVEMKFISFYNIGTIKHAIVRDITHKIILIYRKTNEDIECWSIHDSCVKSIFKKSTDKWLLENGRNFICTIFTMPYEFAEENMFCQTYPLSFWKDILIPLSKNGKIVTTVHSVVKK